MNIPTYEECRAAAGDNKSTPLHDFIYHNEPADVDHADLFREELQALVDFLIKRGEA